MRQVDTCDFCGDAPDGVFEVVPAAVPDGPVRLALCADCQTTLETVVDPLLATDASDGREDDSTSRPADAGATSAANPSTDDAVDDAPNTPTAMRESVDGDESSDSDSGTATAADSDDDGGITIEQPGEATPAERPDGYAQMLRLLENRDGGMPRGDLRALATNAYDLDERTFEAAVDAAIENGDVEDTSDGLRRT